MLWCLLLRSQEFDQADDAEDEDEDQGDAGDSECSKALAEHGEESIGGDVGEPNGAAVGRAFDGDLIGLSLLDTKGGEEIFIVNDARAVWFGGLFCDPGRGVGEFKDDIR